MKRYGTALSIALILSVSIHCISFGMDAGDPFKHAHELYENSRWDEAHAEYQRVHGDIEKGIIAKDALEKDVLIKGHVNYGDVLWSVGVAENYHGNADQARQKWLQACEHWKHRLEGGQFGRKPLGDEEWDGSNPNGKTIVVYSERDAGAFGDTFAMSHLLRYLKEKGANVILVAQKPLQKMYETEGTLQRDYVDRVVVRGPELPEHDTKIYLWSILKDYLEKTPKPFPVRPWLSGTGAGEFKEILKKHKNNLLVAFWYRSSGAVSQAADYRSLSRDPGAHRLVSALQDIPHVTLVCLEGMGHYPINEEEYAKLQEQNLLGSLDSLDVTSCDTSKIINFPGSFDRDRGAFVGTLAVMQYIKKHNGMLVGCDTGLLNAAAGVQKGKDVADDSSVAALLNKKADLRWGSMQDLQDGAIKPRIWYLSDDVEVFQAPQQDNWDTPIAQMTQKVEKRAREHQQKIQQKMLAGK